MIVGINGHGAKVGKALLPELVEKLADSCLGLLT